MLYGETVVEILDSKIALDLHRIFLLFVVGNLFYAVHIGSFFRVVVAEKSLHALNNAGGF